MSNQSARRLIEVIGRRLVIALAFGSVTLAILLCLIGVFTPTCIASATARFFLCLVTSFLFSVFVFVLYPADFKIDLKFIKVPAVLVGPAALWLILFFVFWRTLPGEDDAGVAFTLASSGTVLGSTT